MAQSETTSRISYVRKEKLGSGAFGKVYKAQDIRTKWIYALKVIKCYNNDELKDALMESKVMDELHHPNILTLAQVDVYQDTVYEANVCILFEYCLGGNLNDRLRQPSSKEQNVRWMFQMADAVDHLHSKKIVHRDLKPDNILLTFSEDIKIGDFGFARKFVAMKSEEDTWATHYNTNGARLAYMAPEMISLELYMKSKRGTPIYMAPEVNSMHYTHKADVFSLGLLFYAVEERCFFNAERRYYGAFTPTNVGMVPLADQMLRQGGDVDIPFKSSNKRLVRIISGSLQFDYKKRPNAAQLKRQFEECFDDYIKESKNIKVE